MMYFMQKVMRFKSIQYIKYHKSELHIKLYCSKIVRILVHSLWSRWSGNSFEFQHFSLSMLSFDLCRTVHFPHHVSTVFQPNHPIAMQK